MKDKRKIGEMLVEAGLIDDLQLRAALGEQRQWGGRLCSIIISRGFVDETSVASVLEKQLGEKCISLDEGEIRPEVLKRVKLDVVRKYNIIPVDLEKGVLTVATSDPTDLTILDELAFMSGLRIKPVLALDSGIKRAIERFYEGIDRKISPAAIEITRSGYDISFSQSPETASTIQKDKEEEIVSPVTLFEALSGILIEKGVITREELMEKIKGTMGHD